MVITPSSTCTVVITSITIQKLTNGTGDLTVYGDLLSTASEVSKGGGKTYPSLYLRSSGNKYGFYLGTYGLTITSSGNDSVTFYSGTILPASNFYSWSSSSNTNELTDTRLYRDAASIIAQRFDATQQTFRLYNTFTGSTNYERTSLSGVAGYYISRAAETAGTGADNLDVLDSPAGTGGVGIRPPTETTGGGFVTRIARAVSSTLSGASGSIAVNVPSGKRIKGIQLRVNTAITSGDGGTTWTAAYANTPTTAITSGQAFTKNTKFNALHPAYEVTTDIVTITITPNSGTFSAGVIEAFVYYEDTVALADAP